jgi:hypothetical protein
MSRLTENAVFVVMFLLAINVLVLNLFIISYSRSQQSTAATVVRPDSESTGLECDSNCQDAIIERIKQSSSIPSPTESIIPVNAKQPTEHEWYVPLGSSSTQSRDWAELFGAEATIDTKNYTNIKQVLFEAYLSIPTANGKVWAKLYNVTGQHDVWSSEVSGETEKVTGKQAKITLDLGRNLYRVQMKSSMGYQANLTNARIIIVTDE